MTLLATPEELATYLQTATLEEAEAGDPNVLDTAVAVQALESASAKIRSAAGWSITSETVSKTITSWSDQVVLPSLYLTDVSLTIDGVEIPDGGLVFDRDTGVVEFNPYRSLTYTPWYSGPTVLTYTSGYSDVPDGVRGLCLELAAQVVNNPGDVISVTYANVSETYRRGDRAADDLRHDPRLAPYVLTAFA